MLVLLALALLVFAALFGLAMGRHMSALFKKLEELDPDLWKDLAQPSLKFGSPAASLRANEIMFSGNTALKSHPQLGDLYLRARKYWYIYSGTGMLAIVMLFVAGVTNAQ